MGMGGPGMGPRRLGPAGLLNNPVVQRQLGITAAQVTRIRNETATFMKSTIRNRADVQVKRIELNELMGAETPNRAAIDAKLQEVGAAELALQKSAIDHRLALREILTPAQRQQLQRLQASGVRPNAAATTPPPPPGGARGPGARGTPMPAPPGPPPPGR
jgi:protein CpxP